MGKTLRVLIIEDVADDAELLLLELRRAGYDPVAERIETPSALRAAMERGTWDVILSDASLPQFSAAAAVGLLHEIGIDIPFLVVSGSIGEAAAVELMKAGAHDYLFKDNLARLGPAVERELREAEERRERKRAEQELRRSVQRLAEAERLAHLGSWEMEIGPRTFLWSEELYRIFGLTPEVFAGTFAAFLECVHSEDRAIVADSFERVLRDETQFNEEFRILRPDGSTRVLLAQGVVVRDTRGTPVKLVGTAQDVTERKTLESQFLQAQKMEAVGRLAGGVAHDFNNLLTVIMSYSQLLLEGMGDADPRRQDLEEIQKAAAGAAALTRQLLAFSRQQVLEPKVVNLNTIVSTAGNMLQRLIGEDVALVTVPAPDLWPVKADPGQLEQVIMNLAVNARDAMPDGGKLTIETANLELGEAYTAAHTQVSPGQYVLLSVSDTGVGMDAQMQRRIFEPFFTTKEIGKGTGLGLATVYGIVKQSGGFIWVYSELGHGSTFKVYLPRVDEPAEAESRVGAIAPSARGTETVLLAEDAGALRAVARQILQRSGYTVLEAPDGRAALEQAATHDGPIHLLITDVIMPEMSGRELAARLTELRPGLMVLFVSGYTDDAIIRHGVLEPGIAFLQKPFTPERLTRKVREVLDSAPVARGGSGPPGRMPGGAPMTRILLIDDDAQLREVLRRALENAGYDVIEAQDGAGGVERYRAQGADLVITDIFMPGRDGLEAILQLRREAPGMKIVAISGGDRTGRLDLRRDAEVFGAARTLRKPFDPAELLEVVRELLG